jgi:hypothetical protein
LLPEWEERLPDPASATDHEIMQSDVARRVRLCVARLDPDQRAVIELRWFHQLPFQEIAKRIGKSEGAVTGLHHRGLVKLRDLVQRGVFEAPFEQTSLPDMAQTIQQRKKAEHPPQQPTPLSQQQAQPALVEQLSFFS